MWRGALVKLDILSDPICPWCYIGKANLERALERAGDHPFVVEWHPFQLNPDMPAEGADRREYLDAKFGSPADAARAYANVTAKAREAGIDMHIDRITRTPNTLNAHRLIHWAGIEARQNDVVDALFRAYFTEGRDIGDVDVLADIADAVGLDAGVIRRLLASDADTAGIRARDAHARQMGVSAVPTFIVAQAHAVPGAQPVEVWDKVIAEIMAQNAAEDDDDGEVTPGDTRQ
jgi:predicted DsbA family dithiol-disulfide isomerase